MDGKGKGTKIKRMIEHQSKPAKGVGRREEKLHTKEKEQTCPSSNNKNCHCRTRGKKSRRAGKRRREIQSKDQMLLWFVLN